MSNTQRTFPILPTNTFLRDVAKNLGADWSYKKQGAYGENAALVRADGLEISVTVPWRKADEGKLNYAANSTSLEWLSDDGNQFVNPAKRGTRWPCAMISRGKTAPVVAREISTRLIADCEVVHARAIEMIDDERYA